MIAGQRYDAALGRIRDEDVIGRFIRREPSVKELCSVNGAVAQQWFDATGRLLDTPGALDAVEREAVQLVDSGCRHVIWAGMGGSVGSKFQELGRIIREAASPRVKVCLDTQHMFAAGYDVKTKDGLEAAMSEFDAEVGPDRLVALHANDSKCSLAGGVDRHENIGEGHIGLDGLQNVMLHPAFRDTPFLLEVPGFDNQGPDRRNVEILKGLREKAGLS